MMLCYLGNKGRVQLDDIIQLTIKPEWFDNPIIREAMLEVEHVYKIEGLAFYSSDWGVKSPQSLSNGMKALLLMYYLPLDSDWYSNGRYISNASIGDNVVPFLQRLSVEKDFPVAVNIFLPFDRNLPLEAKDMKTGDFIESADTYLDYYRGRYFE